MKKENKKGTLNVKEIKEAIKAIELYTNLYKRKRLSTEQYRNKAHIALSRLTSERDYIEYLSNIGQN